MTIWKENIVANTGIVYIERESSTMRAIVDFVSNERLSFDKIMKYAFFRTIKNGQIIQTPGKIEKLDISEGEYIIIHLACELVTFFDHIFDHIFDKFSDTTIKECKIDFFETRGLRQIVVNLEEN